MLDVGALLLVFYAYSSWLCAFFGAYFIRGNNYLGANILFTLFACLLLGGSNDTEPHLTTV